MTYLNAQAKNAGNNQGDVYKSFNETMRNPVQKNGVDHYSNWLTFECTEQTAPHPVNTKTYFRLTNEKMHITQFDKSFISAVIDVNIQLTTDAAMDLARDTSNIL